MDEKPYVEFYYQNFLRDTKMLSGAAVGAALNAFLHLKSEPEDQLIGTAEDFGRLFNCSAKEADECLAALSEKNIFTISPLDIKSIVDNAIILRITISEQNKANAW